MICIFMSGLHEWAMACRNWDGGFNICRLDLVSFVESTIYWQLLILVCNMMTCNIYICQVCWLKQTRSILKECWHIITFRDIYRSIWQMVNKFHVVRVKCLHWFILFIMPLIITEIHFFINKLTNQQIFLKSIFLFNDKMPRVKG